MRKKKQLSTEERRERFMALYEPIHTAFERYCKARVYGDMNFRDLMHDTILVAFDKLDELKSEATFLHFLFGISRRILSNANKKSKAQSMNDQSHHFNVVDHNARADRSGDVQTLHKALSYLPEEQREAVILFEISGFSIKEIAQLQDASESNVKQRLHRGRQRLLKLLVEDQNFQKREVV